MNEVPPRLLAAIQKVIHTAAGLPPGKFAYGFRVPSTEGYLTWIASQPRAPIPFVDWRCEAVDGDVTFLIGSEPAVQLVTCTLTATQDEKDAAFLQGAEWMRKNAIAVCCWETEPKRAIQAIVVPLRPE